MVEACLCRQRDGVKKEDRVDELVGGGVVARRENLDETARCDWDCIDGSRTRERQRFVIDGVKKLFVGRRPGEKVELRACDGLRRAGLLAARDMVAIVARSSIDVLG